MRSVGGRIFIGIALVALAVPAAAQMIAVDLPAGRVGEQVMALGRIGRASIVVPDRALWSRRVPALRGPLSLPAALAAIARHADARVEPLGPGSWRLVRRPATPRPVAPRLPERARPEAEPAATQEVVVTASKRDLVRSRLPGEIARVEGRDLELGGAGGSERLASRVTTIASTYLGAGRNKLFIRGIADSSFTGPTQATVGQYFGDLRLSYNAPDPDLRLADLAAVEVLAGPQGTLYGAGSLGGLIRLVPNAPDLSRAFGSAMVGGALTEGGAPSADAQLVANVPLINDRLGLRLVATSAVEGGYIDKPLLDRVDVNRTRISGGRGTLRLELSNRWNVELIGIGQRIRGDDSQYADRDAPPLTRSAPVEEGFNADYTQAQFVLTGAIGDVRLRSSTGVTLHDVMERYDATPPVGPPQLFAQANRTRMTANETRAWRSSPDGSGWLAGFSYVRNATRITRLLGPPGALLPTAGVTNRADETTLYAEGSVALLPGLLTTGGLRVTRTILDGSSEDVPVPTTLAAGMITARRVQTVVLPSAAALVDLTPRVSLFLRYQQGFRPGGLAIEDQFVRQFAGDRVATIEAGVRTRRASDNDPSASLAIAHTRWRDIQADFIDGSGLPSTANIGNGNLWTLEASAATGLGGGWRIDGALSLNHSRIEDSVPALSTLLSPTPFGSDAVRAELLTRLRQIPNIASVTARAGIRYDHPISDRWDLRVDGWVRYVGPSRLGIGPTLGRDQGDVLDNAITLRVSDGRVGLTASASNLANARGNRFALGTPFVTGRDQVTPLRPRTIRLGVDVGF